MKAIDFPMPTTEDLYEMFRDVTNVPFSNVTYHIDSIMDFYDANEKPISCKQAMRIALSLRNMERKDHPLYKQEIKIMRNLVIAMRQNWGPVGEQRTFSESRTNGRRLKFWYVNHRGMGAAEQDRMYAMRLTDLVNRYRDGLFAAGWTLDAKQFFSGGGFGTVRNLSLTITRIGS